MVTSSLIFLTYVIAFGLAGGICLLSLPQTRQIQDTDTRRGLRALLLTSAGWAFSHVGFLVVPTPALKLGFYQLGLIVGLATVGPWLYFCSAYTGRSLHRAPIFRRLLVGVYLVIVVIKLTNPLHNLYFQTTYVTTPFPHLAVQNQIIHWIVMGLAYALATVGYFMLIELFWQVDHDTKPLLGLVGITAMPLMLDLFGFYSPLLLDFTYEPLGVAAFAVGLLYVYREDFQRIQLAGTTEGSMVILDDRDRIRDYNPGAKELFPELETGMPIDEVIPEIDVPGKADNPVISIADQEGPRYYQVTENPFSTGKSNIGRIIAFTDITEREQYRTELERQNERLEQFANMVSHDLRNPLTVAAGRLDLIREEHDTDNVRTAITAIDRMEALIEDLLTLARQGQPIDEQQSIVLAEIVDQCWNVVDTKEAVLTVDTDTTVTADADRLQQLLENLFRNAIDHGGEQVAIHVGDLDNRTGFYVSDDGPGIRPAERDQVFDSGFTTEESGTGFGLAIVKEIVNAHGWDITVTESNEGGARFEIVTN